MHHENSIIIFWLWQWLYNSTLTTNCNVHVLYSMEYLYVITKFFFFNKTFGLKSAFWHIYIISYIDSRQCIWTHIHGLCSYGHKALYIYWNLSYVYIKFCNMLWFKTCFSKLINWYLQRDSVVREGLSFCHVAVCSSSACPECYLLKI